VPEETVPAPPADGRVSTGSAGLDTMLEGGLVPRRPYLIVGPSGTGKTTLAIQFLCEGIRRGEKVLLVTIEEPPNEARINHRGLEPELSHVLVFDAIPDIMRYERVPFKDIASVRSSVAFKDVPLVMRRSPELSAVEVTMTGLEQMLRTEVNRRGYTRLVIDSLTALQYFCMKGFDTVAGAQTFLRFLSDLRVTTVLTVESPLEDVETPERALARGEIRLFRWELEGQTVRAIGVEKFRGNPHDVRLHPYRIGPKGIDINLKVTISRDTREIIQSRWPAEAMPTPVLLEESTSPIDPLAEVVRDLVLVGADLAPMKAEIEAALAAVEAGRTDQAHGHLSRATALAFGLSDSFRDSKSGSGPRTPEVGEAYQRIAQRGEAVRAGVPPTRLPPPKVLELQLERVLSLIRPAPTPPEPEPAPLAPPAASLPPLAIRSEVESRPAPVLEPPVPQTLPARSMPAAATAALPEPVPPGPELPVAEAPKPTPPMARVAPPVVRPPPPAPPRPPAFGSAPPPAPAPPAGSAPPLSPASTAVAPASPLPTPSPVSAPNLPPPPPSPSRGGAPPLPSPPPARSSIPPPAPPSPVRGSVPTPAPPPSLGRGSTPPPPPTLTAPLPPPLPAPSTPSAVGAPPVMVPPPAEPESVHRESPSLDQAQAAQPEGRPPLPDRVLAASHAMAPPTPAEPLTAIPPAMPAPVALPEEPSLVPSAPPAPSSPPAIAASIPPKAVAKRRRKAPVSPRRKPRVAVVVGPPHEPAPAEPATAETPPLVGTPPPVSAGAGSGEAAPAPGAVSTTKPKKRTARKRKAPRVVAATPGPAPPVEPRVVESPPPSEGTGDPAPEGE